MPHTLQTIKSHPNLNPAFFPALKQRVSAQDTNRSIRAMHGALLPVPKQANRYLPHIGAKEAARHEGKVTLGMNTSRALRPTDAQIQRSVDVTLAGIADFSKGADEELAATEIGMIGQTVTWTSSNLEKTGEIIAVVPAGELPKNDFTPKVDISGAPRDHESYVVKANGKHYWPRVSLLSIGGA